MFTNLNINAHIRNWNLLLTEKSHCQRQTNIAFRVADTTTFTFLGAIGGVLLCGVGSLISSSLLGVAAAVIIGIAVGSYAGGLGGGIIGGIYAGLATGVGSLISSSALGVTLTILGCACLAAWCTWTQQDIVWTRNNVKASSSDRRELQLTRRRKAVNR